MEMTDDQLRRLHETYLTMAGLSDENLTKMEEDSSFHFGQFGYKFTKALTTLVRIAREVDERGCDLEATEAFAISVVWDDLGQWLAIVSGLLTQAYELVGTEARS